MNFTSTHNLDFEVAPWEPSIYLNTEWARFKIGTMKGLWNHDGFNYQILALENTDKGNGHFQDLFDWFENSCKRDKCNLLILEINNTRLYNHLITKRGFQVIEDSPKNLIKLFNS
jgi:hypothetical protein